MLEILSTPLLLGVHNAPSKAGALSLFAEQKLALDASVLFMTNYLLL